MMWARHARIWSSTEDEVDQKHNVIDVNRYVATAAVSITGEKVWRWLRPSAEHVVDEIDNVINVDDNRGTLDINIASGDH
jgi:hypothetical protein